MPHLGQLAYHRSSEEEDSTKFLKQSEEHLFSSTGQSLTNEQHADTMVARQSATPIERCVVWMCATYGLTKTLLTFVSRTNAPCAILEQSYLSCGGYGLMTTPDGSLGSR